MKTIPSLLIGLCALSATAQSVKITIEANDGNTSSTNVINAPARVVSGLVLQWQADSASKTNAVPPANALKFSAFIAQEIGDKSRGEWEARGVTAEIVAAGATNAIPPRLIQLWPTLSAAQKTSAVKFVNEIGQ